MNIRARFEEIWPVPDDVYWCSSFGGYWHATRDEEPCRRCDEQDLRLDTFTRCQETTAIHLSLIDEMVEELDSCYHCLEGYDYPVIGDILDRAKQIMEQNK